MNLQELTNIEEGFGQYESEIIEILEEYRFISKKIVSMKERLIKLTMGNSNENSAQTPEIVTASASHIHKVGAAVGQKTRGWIPREWSRKILAVLDEGPVTFEEMFEKLHKVGDVQYKNEKEKFHEMRRVRSARNTLRVNGKIKRRSNKYGGKWMKVDTDISLEIRSAESPVQHDSFDRNSH